MKATLRIITLLLISCKLFSQAPQKMSYQAVIRNNSNALIASSSIGMKVSILQGSISGITVYSETHITTSNANGLVSIEIGGGNIVSGSFNSINWGVGPYFVKTETDPTGGTNYTITGTSQLLSVPYSLFSNCVPVSVSPVGDTVNIGCSQVILPGATGSNYSYYLKNGLVAWFPFSGNAGDSSGYNNHGTLNGPSLTTDRFGQLNKAYDFNGVNNFIDIPTNTGNLSGAQKFSFSFWINPTADTSIIPQAIFTYWHQTNSPIGTPIGFYVTLTNGRIRTNYVSGLSVGSLTNINIGSWYNVIILYDGTKATNSEKQQLFINGIASTLDFACTNCNTTIPNIIGSNGTYGRIGSRTVEFFKGKIDDIRIYNRILSHQEIVYLAAH